MYDIGVRMELKSESKSNAVQSKGEKREKPQKPKR